MTPEKSRKIRVLIVEDSPVMAQLLSHILSSDQDIEVVGIAPGGFEALEILPQLKPDVLTIDINMPRMNGFELTRRIMETEPYPVVIVSAIWSPEEVATTFKAVEAGALAIVGKPHGPGQARHDEDVRKLVQTVKAMSEVRVIRRWSSQRMAQARAQTAPPSPVRAKESDPRKDKLPIRLVAIGASTGGPLVLQTILAKLPRDFPAPIVIVQHIAPGFLEGFSIWLQGATGYSTRVAVNGDCLQAGVAYLAPDGCHTSVEKNWRISLQCGAPEMGLRPSVSHLFASVARSQGSAAAGILLSGMGRDGAEELLLMRQKGALTIAQDQESCVVFGMPGEAVRLGAASHVLGPEQIAKLLVEVVI